MAKKDRKQIRKWHKIIEESGKFDKVYYLKQNPDVRKSWDDPIEHYLLYGAEEGRDPNAWFDSDFYLAIYSDVRESGINPFVHYLLYGEKEGRSFKEGYNTFSVENEEIRTERKVDKNENIAPVGRPWTEEEVEAYRVIDGYGLFDAEWYLNSYDQAREDPRGALEYYIEIGQYRGDNPTYWFNVTSYIKNYPDVKESGINPFVHYLLCTSGKKRWVRKETEFDPEFYRAFYDDLKDLDTRDKLIEHWKTYGMEEKRHPTFESYFEEMDFSFDLSTIDIDTVRRLNPFLSNLNRSEILFRILQIKEIDLLRISDERRFDADFYLKLAISYAREGDKEKSHQLLLYSIYLHPTVQGNELLGNYYLDSGQGQQALLFYEGALKDKEYRSLWLYLNTARIYRELDRPEEALSMIRTGLQKFPLHHQLVKAMDETVDLLWEREQGVLHALAKFGRRDELIERTTSLVTVISESYREVFSSTESEKRLRVPLNRERVLIVGDFHVFQCIRYRIDQKQEQLELAGYEVSQVSWTELSERYDEIIFHDIIIFYRVPALPVIVKAIEQSRALGKVTFYEIDDLIFDPVYPPPYETYGGNISIEEYAGLTYGMPLFQAAASLCEYAIGSTLPLVSRLGKLVTSGQAFLHRNGLDSKNVFMNKKEKDYINIFYGSGTLAHNSDFIELVLEPLDRILDENDNVKLTIVGHLTLPESFLEKHEEKVLQLEKTSTIEEYWSYMSGADINLAVLHSDEINDAKSELKWFEAATFKIPSVVSATRNYLDVIENGKDALIAASSEEWYDALKTLIHDRELRDRIGENAYEKVIANYSLETLSKNIDQIIKKALKDGENQ